MFARLALIACLALGGMVATAAAAAPSTGYPTHPIKLIVSYPPGGPADILARSLAQKMSRELGQEVIIENVGGANGNIGAANAARAAPDGYTLFMMTSSHAANMTLYAKPNYDVVRDFAHITNVASYPLLLVVNPGVKANSVKALISAAKAAPGKLTFASAGTGGGAHLAGELFKTMAGVDLLHVPYKGTGPALVAVIGGQVDLMFAGVSAAAPFVAEGKLRALGITSAQRLKTLPGIPTIAEAGVPGYELSSWLGVSAPDGTPPAIINKLHDAIAAAVASPDFAARLTADGAVPQVTSPAEFSRFVEGEVSRWARIIKTADVKVQ
jgi:tripartite-type tricarboxylate transporter receptor subunit TctC